MRYLFFLVVVSISFASCKRVSVYEKLVTLPSQKWNRAQNAVIIFDIADSSMHQLYFITRHTQKFPFNKILVKLQIQDTAKQVLKSMSISAPLTNSAGGWNGEQMDDIWYNRVKIDPAIFLKPGTYRFVLQQQMNEDVLPNILSVGIAIDQ